MGSRWISSKKVARTDLYCERPVWGRLYILPFGVLYAAWLYGWLKLQALATIPTWLMHKEFFFIPLFLIASAQFITFMSRFWSVSADAFLSYRKVRRLEDAERILVVPSDNCGRAGLCVIHRQAGSVFFVFQQRKFTYDPDKHLFVKLAYPEGHHLGFYKHSDGLDAAQVASQVEHFDRNEFKIPVPSFAELWKEHAVAPFFVFQIFCVALWLLDDYWYYSLFTLVMLCIFESTVVYQRLRNIKDFQTMSIPVVEVSVRRGGGWVKVASSELLPGDLLALSLSTDGDLTVPCDLVLLSGSAIVNEAMLSGESTPLLKESIDELGDDSCLLDVKVEHRNHVLFGGTKIMQICKPESGSRFDHQIDDNNCCVGYVIRTGFATTQGKLVRTMMFSSERMTANNVESFLFILFLMVFAVAAAGYVLVEGAKDASRSRYKLLLECVLIITAVVPPELPMELSMAVNNSLMALSQFAIFVMEPFRIPFAGKVDVCCFDKTGTLTGENLEVEGLVLPDKRDKTALTALPQDIVLCAGTCHSLFKVNDTISGDSMEKAMLSYVQWTVETNDHLRSSDGKQSTVILHRFPFSSALKRMSVVAKVGGGGGGAGSTVKLFVKGAPETIKALLKRVPATYDSTYEAFAQSGARVLSLAQKPLASSVDHEQAKCLDRGVLEDKLEFLGFIVFRCPLKPDSKKAIRSLKGSGHQIVIITGDNLLTAMHTGRELNVLSGDVLQGELADDGSVVYRTSAGEVFKSCESLGGADICLTGDVFDKLRQSGHENVIKKCVVFARASPTQKEDILAFYKSLGLVTLMCGDGTNDVGALKQAHVGVALLDGKPEDLQKILYEMRQQAFKRQKAELEASAKAWRKKLEDLNGAALADPRAEEALLSLNKALQDDPEGPTFRLGDASVAAPFSSRISTIESVCNIIRQGRCTLVTTVQMYKILAVNSLISAYSLSVLHLQGIRYGDFQATLTGLLLASCFLFLTKAQPIKKLTPDRPQSNIFNAYLLASVLGQFALHVFTLFFVVSRFARAIDEKNPFEPGLVNTAVYLLSLLMQVSTFVVNYQGRPFRESLFENKPLRNSLAIVSLVSVVAASEAIPEFNQWIQLVPMPVSFRRTLCWTMALDFFGCLAIEKLCSAFLFFK